MPILTMSQMPDLAQRVEIFSPKWGTVASQSVSHPGYVQNQNYCPRFFSLWITPDVVVLQSLSPVQLLATHGLQHARLPCPSPSPRVCSNSSPLGRWCQPTISSSDEMRFSWCPHEKYSILFWVLWTANILHILQTRNLNIIFPLPHST